MIERLYRTNCRPNLAALLLTGLTLAALSGGLQTTQAADGVQGPPRIVSTSPAIGSTEVDPATTTEITVTFDRDMGGGMSWTGGGSEYPTIPEGERAQWRDKRTCVLPVKLQVGRYYRVGINSRSYQNFRSAAGVPAVPSAILFTTQGASEALKLKVKVPRIVSIDPPNGAKDVSPSIKELRVTFDVPMSGGCSWCGGGEQFPNSPEGKRAYWTADRKTCVLPVELKPNWTYQLGLNSPSFRNFQSASGLPLEPVGYTFKTKAE